MGARGGALVAGLALVPLVFLLHAWHLRVVAEDAFITFRFARHLAEGHGLVWNMGEAPVEGYTNFLWLVLCAALLRAGLDLVLAGQLLGVVAAIATLACTYRIGRHGLGLSGAWALLPCLFLAVSGPFANWATSGMETALFTFLLVLAASCLGAWAGSGASRHLAGGYAALLLATLARPEGFLAFAVWSVLVAIASSHRREEARRHLALGLAVYIVPFLVYFLWRYSYFGFPLPNTFYAKTGGGLDQHWRGARYLGLFALYFVLLPFAPTLALLAWRARRRWAMPGAPGAASLARRLRQRFTTWLAVALVAAYALYVVYIGGDYMAMFRFLVPVLPFIYLLLAAAMQRGLAEMARPRPRGALAIALIGFAAALTFIHSTRLEARLFPKPELMHGTYRGVQYERRYVARFTVIGRFFDGYKRSSAESIALEPIGAIGYYSGLTLHSAQAIVDPIIAHRAVKDRVLGQGLPGHEKTDWLHAISKRPTFILFSRRLRSEPEPFPAYPPEIDPLVRDAYRLRWAWLEDPGNGESGYFTFLERRDR